jgi:ribosomal protein L28
MFSFFLRNFASNTSQRGLWHAKDVRPGFHYTFSHKATKRTFRPNVKAKHLWSHALNRSLHVSVSTTALKCIKKKGSLDRYLTETDPRLVRSQFGALLKGLIERKTADPEWVVPYIKGTRRAWTPRFKKDERKNEVIWRPPELRGKDFTGHYFDVFDPNAPPRPEMMAEEEKKAEKVKETENAEERRRAAEVENTGTVQEMADAIGKVLEMQNLGLETRRKEQEEKAKKSGKELKGKKAKKNQKEIDDKAKKRLENQFLKKFNEVAKKFKQE